MCLISDKAIGGLYNRGALEREISIVFFNKSITCLLRVQTENNLEISENQRSAYIEFSKNEKKILSSAEQHVKEYCLNHENWEQQPLQNLIDSITLKAIKVLFSEPGKPRRIGLILDWSLDPELGIGVLIENEKVSEVSVQDIVLG